MEKLDPKTDGATPDIVKQNIEKMKALFPDVFTEGKVDLDALCETLGDYADERQERYSFTWNGKSKARMIAQTPSTGTLRPCPDESVNWDTTQNLFIEGDNLEVLKLLQKSYHKKVKMIYIDPPYNTGGDFIYPDNFRDNIQNYLELTGQTDFEGRRLTTNAETSGRYHTDWLNMMYPRLKLARNLLRDDGVIFISIDDNEAANLRKLCDEVFGEENFRNTIIVRRRVKSLNSQFAQDGLQTLNVGFEYVVVYAKSNSFTMMPLRMKKENASANGRWDVFWSNADRPTMRYNVLGFTPETGQWRYSEEKAVVAVENYKKYQEEFSEKMTLEEYWKKTGCCLRFIRRINNGRGKNGGVQHWVPPSETSLRTSTWTDIEVSQIHKEIDVPFENPKNRALPQELIKLSGAVSNDLILDFFAGSCTTAHATLELNKEDNGNRKFIMIQIPELCDDKSEAFKAGYKTIAEIGKERIRHVINKLEDELAVKAKERQGSLLEEAEDTQEPDLGFKVFKLDASNIKPWDADFDNLETALFDSIENIKPDRSEADVLYELLLKYGLDLAVAIKELVIDDCGLQIEDGSKDKSATGNRQSKIYVIGAGALVVCLADHITLEIVERIAALKEELNPEVMRVVFKDSGFADDVVKTNAVQILRQAEISDVKSL